MSHSGGERQARGSLLDALSTFVEAHCGTKGFIYRKIKPTMALDREDIGDLSDVILQENSDAETQVGSPWHAAVRCTFPVVLPFVLVIQAAIRQIDRVYFRKFQVRDK
jgi:hypothetical protein